MVAIVNELLLMLPFFITMSHSIWLYSKVEFKWSSAYACSLPLHSVVLRERAKCCTQQFLLSPIDIQTAPHCKCAVWRNGGAQDHHYSDQWGSQQ